MPGTGIISMTSLAALIYWPGAPLVACQTGDADHGNESFRVRTSLQITSRAAQLSAITTRNKKLLGAPGLTTRSKDATNGAPGIATRNKNATVFSSVVQSIRSSHRPRRTVRLTIGAGRRGAATEAVETRSVGAKRRLLVQRGAFVSIVHKAGEESAFLFGARVFISDRHGPGSLVGWISGPFFCGGLAVGEVSSPHIDRSRVMNSMFAAMFCWVIH